MYLAAGQVQGSVPILVQQCQVSLGPVKEDGWTTPRHKICLFFFVALICLFLFFIVIEMFHILQQKLNPT